MSRTAQATFAAVALFLCLFPLFLAKPGLPLSLKSDEPAYYLMALSLAYDAALHAIFVGFVFSMVLGHAPIIVPAVLRVRYPYHPVLYLALAVLHASLVVRVFVSTPAGAWGNAAAIALFIATSIVLATIRRRAGGYPGAKNPSG